jgi:hypothetical protein
LFGRGQGLGVEASQVGAELCIELVRALQRGSGEIYARGLARADLGGGILEG